MWRLRLLLVFLAAGVSTDLLAQPVQSVHAALGASRAIEVAGETRKQWGYHVSAQYSRRLFDRFALGVDLIYRRTSTTAYDHQVRDVVMYEPTMRIVALLTADGSLYFPCDIGWCFWRFDGSGGNSSAVAAIGIGYDHVVSGSGAGLFVEVLASIRPGARSWGYEHLIEGRVGVSKQFW